MGRRHHQPLRVRARRPRAGRLEIWEIKNPSGGWFHPLHIQLVDFKILDRNGKPPFAYERGPKDVVYVGENETVRVIMALRGPHNPISDAHEAEYGPRTGRYMMHCHNLVHTRTTT